MGGVKMANLNRIEKAIGHIPWFNKTQAEFLEQRVFPNLKPKNIVEIGTYQGSGTCYLAELAKDYGGHVTTIDIPWTGIPEDPTWTDPNLPNHPADQTVRQDDPDRRVTVEELLTRCKLKNVTTSRDGAEAWFLDYFQNKFMPSYGATHLIRRAQIDFIYLDAHNEFFKVGGKDKRESGYKWANTAAQFIMAFSSLRPGGWIVLDDLYHKDYPEIQAVWENIVIPLTNQHYTADPKWMSETMKTTINVKKKPHYDHNRMWSTWGLACKN